MEDLYPNISRSIFLEKKIRTKLETSLISLIELVDEVLPPEKYQALIKKIKFICSENQVSGLLYGVHYALINAANNKDEETFLYHCNQLLETDFKVKTLRFLHADSLCEDIYYENLLSFITQDKAIKTPIFSSKNKANQINFSHSKNCTKNALNLMQKALPDFYDEFKILTKEILFYNSNGAKSGTSFYLFGLVYMREKTPQTSRIEMIDTLIHEQSHLYLHAISSFDEIVLNPINEKFTSPFRQDNRPMIGIYHAFYVIARLLIAFQELTDTPGLTTEEYDQISSYLKKYKSLYSLGSKTIETHAKLTDLGKKIFTSACTQIKLSMDV